MCESKTFALIYFSFVCPKKKKKKKRTDDDRKCWGKLTV